MKWLVFSDSHGELSYMKAAIEKEKPQRVLHLGDVSPDAERVVEWLEKKGLHIPVEMVRGNCDGWHGDAPEEKEVFFGDKRVWMVHGNAYYVQMGSSMLVSEARARGVDVVLYGHTHVPQCEWNGLWVMNPGTINPRSVRAYPRASYGVIETKEDGSLNCRVVDAPRVADDGKKKRPWSILG